MRKIIGLARLILGLSVTVWIMNIKPGHPENQAIPELTYVGTSEVTISWRTRSPDVATAYSQANEPVASSGSHRGTRYLAYCLHMQIDDFPNEQITRMVPPRSGLRMMPRLV